MEDFLITIKIENDNSIHTFSEGISLKSILTASNLPEKDSFLAAYVNNCPKSLQNRIYSSKSIRFIHRNSSEGQRIYLRTAQMVMEKAIFDITGEVCLVALHSVGQGLFFEMNDSSKNSFSFTEQVKQRMKEIIECNIPIVRKKFLAQDTIDLYRKQGAEEKLRLLETRPSFFYTLYDLDGYQGYYYGSMAPSTGYITLFDLKPCDRGILLMMPDKNDNSKVEGYVDRPKLYNVYREYKEWSNLVNTSCIGDINKAVMSGCAKHAVLVGEALLERKISKISMSIYDRNIKDKTKVVMIAGPSSSGKTTFTKRLSIHIKVNGLTPIALSMDDYFVGRDKTPKDKNGNYDFECLEAVDVELFNQNVMDLIEGKTIDIPRYDFITGTRVYKGEKLSMGENSILLIEGIHALNPKLLSNIDKKQIFRIYASALTAISIDHNNIIHTTDNRLLRRIVRDYNFRGRSAYETLKAWKSVRDGEEKNIFPYQEYSDEMISTSLFYELSALAPKAEPLLRAVPQDTPEFAEAVRLLKFLTYFVEIPQEIIPQYSILREFIGGSIFDY